MDRQIRYAVIQTVIVGENSLRVYTLADDLDDPKEAAKERIHIIDKAGLENNSCEYQVIQYYI